MAKGKSVELSENVVTMARKRIENVFANGLPVYLSISGGKDSIVLAHLVYDLIRQGRVDPKQLTVAFVDEEAMHEEVIQVTKDWRKRFLKVGAKFDWWCIEVKHFNCFNALTNDESFICWDRTMRDRWIRSMPSFARTSHPALRPREDSYQDFLSRVSLDGITMTGVRTAESIQRLRTFRNKIKGRTKRVQPIYDWKDADVWRYIRDFRLDFPETYLHLYQVGTRANSLRLSQFFSIDTARVLVKLSEYDPSLMEKVIRREPNAYLAALYWDSSMFRSGTSRKVAEKAGKVEKMDFRAEVIKKVWSPVEGITSPDPAKSSLARSIRALMLSYGGILMEKHWREAYNILEAGDPKSRSVRALYSVIGDDMGYAQYAKELRERRKAEDGK